MSSLVGRLGQAMKQLLKDVGTTCDIYAQTVTTGRFGDKQYSYPDTPTYSNVPIVYKERTIPRIRTNLPAIEKVLDAVISTEDMNGNAVTVNLYDEVELNNQRYRVISVLKDIRGYVVALASKEA